MKIEVGVQDAVKGYAFTLTPKEIINDIVEVSEPDLRLGTK